MFSVSRSHLNLVFVIFLMALLAAGCALGTGPDVTPTISGLAGEAENCDTPEADTAGICAVPGLEPAATDAGLTPSAEPAGVEAPPLPQTSTTVASPVPSPSPTEGPPTPEGPQYQPVRFAVIGDYGREGDPAADVAALIKSRLPDLVLTTGDNNYPSGEQATIDANIGQYYHEFIFPYQGGYGEGASENRFFPTLGNHDWDTAGAQAYFDYFTLPGNERYYDFAWGPVHFFALDSDSREPDGVSAGSTQAAWLQEGLAAAEEPWKIVYMHHPPYSSATHGSIDWMQWPFAEWGATAVLAGHDHVYERLEVDGLTYIITGLGGFGPYDFNDPLSGSLVRFNDDLGALFVEATEDTIAFEFVTRSGDAVDSITLSGN